MKKILKGIGIAFVILIALGIFASMGDEPSSTTSTPPVNSQSGEVSNDPPKESEPASPAEPAVKTYNDGMHKVGTDIPAGEYVLVASGMAYFEVAKDSKGDMDSIVANDNFNNRSIVTVQDGQYLKLQRCKAYAFADAPKVAAKDGFMDEGMYKVGIDLPAGEYKVIPEGMGYVEVSSNSTHDMGSIVSNDNISGESYITVQDGQYLKLSRAKLKLNQ